MCNARSDIWGNLKEKDNLDDTGTDRKIISQWMLMKYNVSS